MIHNFHSLAKFTEEKDTVMTLVVDGKKMNEPFEMTDINFFY